MRPDLGDSAERSATIPISAGDPAEPSADDRAALSLRVGQVLRTAAESQARGEFHDDAMRMALRPACEEARRCNIQVEHVLIICKNAWRSLPEAQRLRRDISDETIARVITLAINEFFEDRNSLLHGARGQLGPTSNPAPTTMSLGELAG